MFIHSSGGSDYHETVSTSEDYPEAKAVINDTTESIPSITTSAMAMVFLIPSWKQY
jgi:hypothetical protein